METSHCANHAEPELQSRPAEKDVAVGHTQLLRWISCVATLLMCSSITLLSTSKMGLMSALYRLLRQGWQAATCSQHTHTCQQHPYKGCTVLPRWENYA